MVSFQPEGVDTIENLYEKDDFECGQCLKKYKRNANFEKHITTGDCGQTTKKENNSKNEENDESGGDIVPPISKQNFEIFSSNHAPQNIWQEGPEEPIYVLRGKPLDDHPIEEIRIFLKKCQLNDKGTKPELIKTLEQHFIGKKTFTGIIYQSRSTVVLHPNGKQCYHCGIKQKVLKYIALKNGKTCYYCSAECRFSAEVPTNFLETQLKIGQHHGETSKSQQYYDDSKFLGEDEVKKESDESFVKSESQRSGRFWFWLSDDDDDDELNESGENFVKPKSQTEELNDSVDDSMKKRRRLSADRKLLGQNLEELFLPSKLRSGIK